MFGIYYTEIAGVVLDGSLVCRNCFLKYDIPATVNEKYGNTHRLDREERLERTISLYRNFLWDLEGGYRDDYRRAERHYYNLFGDDFAAFTLSTLDAGGRIDNANLYCDGCNEPFFPELVEEIFSWGEAVNNLVAAYDAFQDILADSPLFTSPGFTDAPEISNAREYFLQRYLTWRIDPLTSTADRFLEEGLFLNDDDEKTLSRIVFRLRQGKDAQYREQYVGLVPLETGSYGALAGGLYLWAFGDTRETLAKRREEILGAYRALSEPYELVEAHKEDIEEALSYGMLPHVTISETEFQEIFEKVRTWFEGEE